MARVTADNALPWLKEHDPEATTPGYSDRYAPVPRRSKEVTASALDQVDEDGNVKPFDDWYGGDDTTEPTTGVYIPAELQDEVAARLRSLPQVLDQHYRKALAEGLTAAEMDHFTRYEAGETQQEIAARLRVSQKTISLRQGRMLAKVDAIHRNSFSRPYPKGRGIKRPLATYK